MPNSDDKQDPVRTRDSDLTPGNSWAEEDTISVADAIRKLYSYRLILAGVTIGVTVLFLLLSLILFFFTPVQVVVTVGFHLDFDGVDRGEYPNQMKFSVQDIVSVPVLTEVYEVHGLEQFLSLQEFFDSVFVLEESASAQLLDKEYHSKLSDLKMSAVDRLRLEDEYRAKRQTLKAADYTLNFVREQGVIKIPTTLVSKILTEILANWADYADKTKGALKYRIPTYSKNFIRKETLKSEDYVVAIDLLRSRFYKVLENVNSTAGIPGAQLVRVGPDRFSLAEVRAILLDTLQLKVEPLLMTLQSTGVSKNPQAAFNYYESRLYNLELNREDANRRIQTLREALDHYLEGTIQEEQGGPRKGFDPSTPALIPQFSASFLDRLLDMSTESNDQGFRQDLTERIVRIGMEKVSYEKEAAYYTNMVKIGLRTRKKVEGGIEGIETTVDNIVAELVTALELLELIHEELSANNLNPRTALYAIKDSPRISSERSISLKSLVVYGVLGVLAALFLAILTCAVHGVLRGR